MQVSELIDYLDWVESEIKGKRIEQLYQSLFNIIQQNSQSQARQPFENQRNALITALVGVDFSRLNQTQLRFADETGLNEVIGKTGADAIEDLLVRNALDIATVAAKIDKQKGKLATVLQKMTALKDSTKGLFVEEVREFPEAMVHVRFKGSVAIENISDLKKWSANMHTICRGLAMAHGQTPESVQVLGASRGSLIFDLGMALVVTETLTRIMTRILGVADKVQDIRRKVAEVRALHLDNEQIAVSLEQEAKKIEEKGQELVAEETAKAMHLSGEKAAALKKAVELIYDFVNGGGEFDVLLSEQTQVSTEEDGAMTNTSAVVARIRENTTEAKRLQLRIETGSQGVGAESEEG